MKYTVFSNDGKEYIMHNGVKIHRTTIMPDVYRFNCSLCSYSVANQYNVIRHINTRHKDYVTDNAVNNEMEGARRAVCEAGPTDPNRKLAIHPYPPSLRSKIEPP